MTPGRSENCNQAPTEGRANYWGANNGLQSVVAARRLLCIDLFLRNATYREISPLLGISCTAVMGHVKAVIGPIRLSRTRRHKAEVRKAYLTDELWRALWPKLALLAEQAQGLQESLNRGHYFGKNHGRELPMALKRLSCYNLHMEGRTCREIGAQLGISRTAVSHHLVSLAGRVEGRIRIRRRASLKDSEPAVRELARTGLLPVALGRSLEVAPPPPIPLWMIQARLVLALPSLMSGAESAGQAPGSMPKVDVAQDLRGKLRQRPEVSYWGANAGLEPLVAERWRRIEELFDAGWAYKQIGMELGIGAPAVHRYAKAITGLAYPRKPTKEYEEPSFSENLRRKGPVKPYWGANAGLEPVIEVRRQRIKELFDAGWTYARIGQELGISAPAVHKHLKAATGLKYPRRVPRWPSWKT